jgi:hypothetical protein
MSDIEMVDVSVGKNPIFVLVFATSSIFVSFVDEDSGQMEVSGIS